MDMNRREFLKIMLGTVPAFTVNASMASLWLGQEPAKPVSQPVMIMIDGTGYLYDPDFEPELISVRTYYGIDQLTAESRLEFYIDHFGRDYLQDILREDEEDPDDVALSPDRIEELDSCLENYLDEEIDPEVGSFREQMNNSEYWIGGWLYDNLPSDAFRASGLDYVEGEFPGSSFCAVRYRDDIGELNAVLLRSGLNAVCVEEGRADL
jgi:hypothetical protein